MRITAVLIIVAAFAAGSLFLVAQETTGTIVGTVSDTSGAVVPKATVTVTNTDRNAVVRTLTTTNTGQYVAALLPIGHYSVSVTAPGYKVFTKSNIELNVNDRLSINGELSAGSVNETVNVQADSLQVETQSATAQGLINGTQIRQLALSARNYEEMVALTPGVASAVSDTIYVGVETPGGGTNQVSYSINGTRFSQNNWTIDGADNVDRGGNFSLLNYPSVDAIQEFKVLRSMYDAEYGRGAGGQINVITRSGTSQFHGGAYEFFRNDVLNANRYMNNREGLDRPPLRYNDFGWTLGGPVYIPGHYNKEKNKTFFFYSEELRRIVTYSTNVSTVPNADERRGIFTQPVCIVGSGMGCTELAPGTQLNPALISPAATAYLTDVYSHIPLPQDTETDQLTDTARNQFNYRQEIIRIDHQIGSRLNLTGRWMNDSIPTLNPAGLFGFTNVLGYATTNTNSPGKSLLIHAVMTLKPTLLNEAGYSWSYGAIVSTPIGFSNISAAPHVASAIQLPFAPAIARIPDLAFESGSGLSGFGPYKDYNRNHNWFDNLTWVVGRHTLKFGGTYHRYQKNENDAGGFTNPNGTFSFVSTGPDDQSSFEQEWASFLLGNVTSFRQSDRDFAAQIRQHMLEFYGQDEFRALKNLTLSIGLRYTHYGQPTDANNQATSFYPGAYDPTKAPVLVQVGDSVQLCTQTSCPAGATPNPNYNPLNGLIVSSGNKNAVAAGATPSPFGSAMTHQNNLDFAPRFGFAWDPWSDGKTAIRGGYGLFFDSPAIGFVENNLFVNPPFVKNITIANTNFQNPGSVAPTPDSSPRFLKGVSSNWKLPYTQSWSLDIQHELPMGFVLDMGYYGNKGTHLLGVLDINQPQPGAYRTAGLADSINQDNFQLVDLVRPFKGYGPINEYSTVFSSNYHSLQVGMQKRFAGNSLISVNYTWSHALTNGGNDAFTPQNNNDLRAEYGPADFDRRHIFTANFVYEFPWLKAQKGFVGHLLGGWEMSGIITANSGLYLTPLGTFGGVDPAGLGLLDPNANTDNLYFAPAARPDQIGDCNAGPHTADEWVTAPPNLTYTDPPLNGTRPGNARRGCIKGPGIQRWDMSLFKNIKLTERTGLQLRFEGFNVFNHTNFDAVDTGVTSETFGQVVSTREPRIIQIGVKLNF
jgi:outer membrane receptor protein involved in Fe transport